MTRTLRPADRCDRCGAQAFVKVDIASGGDLLFCGHHYAHYELALLPVAYKWYRARRPRVPR